MKIKYIYFEVSAVRGSNPVAPKMQNENILVLKPHTNSDGVWSFANITERTGCSEPTHSFVYQYWIDLEKFEYGSNPHNKNWYGKLDDLVKESLTKLEEALNSQLAPIASKVHPDTYDKPYFLVVPSEVPQNALMEQLYLPDGEKYQRNGYDVRLAIRTEKADDIFRTPTDIMNFMRGRWGYDAFDADNRKPMSKSLDELLSMCKSYQDKTNTAEYSIHW